MTLKEWILKQNYTDEDGSYTQIAWLNDLVNNGVASGIIGLVDFEDIRKFHDNFEHEIDAVIDEYCHDQKFTWGQFIDTCRPPVETYSDIVSHLVWRAIEITAQALVVEMEAD